MADSIWLFVVDTEQFAGNFERQLCAYMTGRIGDCGVGDTERDEFNREMHIQADVDAYDERHPFRFVIDQPDEHGCNRPCTIFPTPGWFNNGMGGEYRDAPDNEAVAKADHRQSWLANIKPGCAEIHAAYCRAMADRPLVKFPAYLSVAIFMERRPTAEEVGILLARARKYCQLKITVTITGFRLIRRDVIETEEPLLD